MKPVLRSSEDTSEASRFRRVLSKELMFRKPSKNRLVDQLKQENSKTFDEDIFTGLLGLYICRAGMASRSNAADKKGVGGKDSY